MADRQCTKCGETKPLDQFPMRTLGGGKRGYRRQCSSCYFGDAREKRAKRHYKIDRGLEIARSKRSYAQRQSKRKAAGLKTKDWWGAVPERVNRAARRGMEYWPRAIRQFTLPDEYSGLVEQNARQAWRWWVKVKAPAWWVREAYRDRPWRNPRLTDTEQWRIQYWCDPAFRAKEIEKVQRIKVKRRERIDLTDDGTLTGETIVRLFAEAKCCTYCGKAMRSVEKSLDHVVPLMLGGSHSITNVVIACKTCNFRKGTSTPAEWQGEAA